MIAFQVNDMTCGHCIGTITRAVQAADPAAGVRIDLGTKRVLIENAEVSPAALAAAIEQAGYTPVAAGPSEAPAPAARRSGCCCASRAAAPSGVVAG